MARLSRLNVAITERKIFESIASSEPIGIRVSHIAGNIGKDRTLVTRYCKRLEDIDYIYRKNKQAPYHLTDKAFSYPRLHAFSFGIQAIRNIRHLTKWICEDSKFCNDDFCRRIISNNIGSNIFRSDASATNIKSAKECLAETQKALKKGDIPLALDQLTLIDKELSLSSIQCDEQLIDQLNLFEFANRIGALIVYILIEAVRPKKLLSHNDDLLRTDIPPIKGKYKQQISRDWVDNAIKPTKILWEFGQIWMVKRGLAIFNRIPINKTLNPEVQRHLIGKQEDLRQYSPQDPYWSLFEMDEENFDKLVSIFKSVYPNIFVEFEHLRRKLPSELASDIKMSKEQSIRKGDRKR